MIQEKTSRQTWEAELALLRCVDCGGGLEVVQSSDWRQTGPHPNPLPPGEGTWGEDPLSEGKGTWGEDPLSEGKGTWGEDSLLKRDGSDREDKLCCRNCGRDFPIREGLLNVMGELAGNNQVAAEFYDGPLWPKFRFWEHFTFFLNGGARRARSQVLRHLPPLSGTRLLEVAIGDGSNLPLIPPDCEVYGNDISVVQLRDCRRKFPDRHLRLVLGEAESLPFCDHTFDNVLSLGALNYFNDPLQSLREMARVVKPQGFIVVSDEYPSLPNRMLGHWIGLPQLDRWIMSRLLRLGDAFTEMVDRHRNLQIEPIVSQALEDYQIHSLWGKVGYCVVGRPKASPGDGPDSPGSSNGPLPLRERVAAKPPGEGARER